MSSPRRRRSRRDPAARHVFQRDKRSGDVSGYYFDKYLFESDPRLLREIAVGPLGLVTSQVGS